MSFSRDVLLKLSETTSPQKLFPSDCITLYRKSIPNNVYKIDWFMQDHWTLSFIEPILNVQAREGVFDKQTENILRRFLLGKIVRKKNIYIIHNLWFDLKMCYRKFEQLLKSSIENQTFWKIARWFLCLIKFKLLCYRPRQRRYTKQL